MTKYIITIAYDGSKYCGLQKLKNQKTVQGELERVLSNLEENTVKVYSSGRTDRGVHAEGQVCTFELEKNTTPYKLSYYINRSTSPYLHVKTCEETRDKNFHPRFSVKKKTYKYIINTGPYDPIRQDYVYNYNKQLDIDAMRKAADLLTGPHNYKAFVVGKHRTCESIVDSIYIMKNENIITVQITGKAFYTYMVRYIVSSLILIGSNTITTKDIEEMLLKGKRTIEFSPAPPNGLYLEKIEY